MNREGEVLVFTGESFVRSTKQEKKRRKRGKWLVGENCSVGTHIAGLGKSRNGKKENLRYKAGERRTSGVKTPVPDSNKNCGEGV